MTLLSTTTTNTGSAYTISSISQDYINLLLIWQGLSCTAGSVITLTFAGSNASIAGVNQDGTAITANAAAARLMPDTQAANNTIACTIFGYTAAACKTMSVSFGGLQTGYRGGGYLGAHFYDQAISTLTVTLSAGSFSAGTLKIYGVK
jgi:enoyl-[acyl-carrier-protein] reductase (NADH)